METEFIFPFKFDPKFPGLGVNGKQPKALEMRVVQAVKSKRNTAFQIFSAHAQDSGILGPRASASFG